MSSIKEFIFKKGAMTKTPVNGNFELTPRCNFNCKMCYIHMSQSDACKAGKELDAEKWIELGKQAVKKGMLYVLLTGGEPLLRPDFKHIYTSLVKMGLMVSVNTNGSLIDDELIECFRTYRPERLNITLYGVSERTYAELCGNSDGWKKVSQNIDNLLNAGILITLNTTFTKLNVGEMQEIVSFAEKRGIPVRMSGHIFPPVRGGSGSLDVTLCAEEQGRACAKFEKLTLDKETLERRIKSMKACHENGDGEEIVTECSAANCMAGRSAFWISWDGKMYPCGMLSRYAQDVTELSFDEAWQKTTESVKTLMLPKECTNCKFKKICSACAATFECSAGSSDKLYEEICKKTKAYAESLLGEE